MSLWKTYDEAVSAQRRGWKTQLREDVSAMLSKAYDGSWAP